MNTLAKRLAPLAVIAAGSSLSGCAYIFGDFNEVEGVALAELDVSAPAPDEVQLAGPDNIIITQSDGFVITVEGDERATAALRFDRDGDSLTIARDQNVYSGSSRATVRISMPAPGELGIAGSGRIESETVASDADLGVAGTGNIVIGRVEANNLDVDIAGSGNVSAMGTTQKLAISIAGSGGIDFSDLNAEDVSIDIAGSGDVDLASDGTVAASIAGSGDVNVTGSATCSVSAAGSGTVNCRPAPIAAAATDDAVSEGDGDAETAAE